MACAALAAVSIMSCHIDDIVTILSAPKVVLRPRLTADLGLDLNPLQQRARPVACLEYEVQSRCN